MLDTTAIRAELADEAHDQKIAQAVNDILATLADRLIARAEKLPMPTYDDPACAAAYQLGIAMALNPLYDLRAGRGGS